MCSQLRKACHSRGIWQSLLQASDIQNCPDLPFSSDIASLSVPKVRSSVLNAIARHRAWSASSSTHRLDVKNLPFPTISPQEEGVAEPRLIPGGTHLLLIKEGQVQLWSIDPQECVWKAPRSAGYDCCMNFAFELIDDGRSLRILTIDVDVESRANV